MCTEMCKKTKKYVTEADEGRSAATDEFPAQLYDMYRRP